MDKLLKIFKALADKNRVRIMSMLTKKELCVCEITHVLELATSTVSKHLSILKDAGLINERKDGRWVNFKLAESDDPKIQNILEMINDAAKEEELLQIDLTKVEKADRNEICKTF